MFAIYIYMDVYNQTCDALKLKTIARYICLKIFVKLFLAALMRH